MLVKRLTSWRVASSKLTPDNVPRFWIWAMTVWNLVSSTKSHDVPITLCTTNCLNLKSSLSNQKCRLERRRGKSLLSREFSTKTSKWSTILTARGQWLPRKSLLVFRLRPILAIQSKNTYLGGVKESSSQSLNNQLDLRENSISNRNQRLVTKRWK